MGFILQTKIFTILHPSTQFLLYLLHANKEFFQNIFVLLLFFNMFRCCACYRVVNQRNLITDSPVKFFSAHTMEWMDIKP